MKADAGTYTVRVRARVLFLALAGFVPLAVAQQTSAPAAPPAVDQWVKHYYERVALFEAENAPKQNVVLLGSSHIEGFDAALLPRWRVINRGIASDRIGIGERGILRRLDCSVFDCEPSAIVLENGVNDLGELHRNAAPSLDEIETCFREVVRRIRARLPGVPLIIVDLFPTRDRYADLTPLIVDFNGRLKRIANDYGCTFLPIHPSLVDEQGLLREEYSRDGLHLTPAGYQVWAGLIDAALANCLPAEKHAAPASDVANAGTPLDATEATREPESNLSWYDARRLAVEGKGWTDTEKFFERLPARAQPLVTEPVWTLGKRTAGLAVRFATDSKTIAATWDGGGAMNHMAATGNSGLDLYARRDGRWIFRGVGKPKTSRTTATLASGLSGEMNEYLLYLPLYSDVTELLIGVEPDARMIRPAPRPAERARPLVFYGTSITQGGCASRAGMCHPAILGRRLDREVINLGFSGSGKMESEMARLLGELDAAVYVLECLPNMTTEMVRERVRPFVRILREARPETPILLVESPLGGPDDPGNRELRAAFADLVKDGVERLHYLPGESLLAGDENGTVDGVHPTDLGFDRMAAAYEPILRTIMAPGDRPGP